MSKDMNVWNGVGRATRDAEIRTTNGGLTVCKFSIAVNGFKDNDVSFFNCVMFGKFAEGVGKYITKGKQLAVTAELKQNTWQDRDTGKNRSSVELIVNGLNLLGGGQSAQATEKMFKSDDSDSFEEDVPF